MKKILKMGFFTSMIIVAMCATVFAASFSYNKTISLSAGHNGWSSGAVEFTADATHTEKVDIGNVQKKGNATVSIDKHVIFDLYTPVCSTELSLTTASAGLRYTIGWGKVSKGQRYYGFGTDDTLSFSIAGFSDTW